MGPDESEIETWDPSKLNDHGVTVCSTDSYVYTYKSPFTTDTTVFSGGKYVYRPPDGPWPRPWLADEPSRLWDWKDFGGYVEHREEEKPQMSWSEHVQVDEFKGFHDKYVHVRCVFKPDLTEDRILKCLSIMKSELMLKCMPFKVDHILCKMTPFVKNNIIKAWRRTNMYGKKVPFVACYDEYGRRLNDKIEIDTLRGVTIQIVNPIETGEYLLEFEGVIRDIDSRHE